MYRKEIAILGASGSIGTQLLEILRTVENDFRLKYFSVHRNLKILHRTIDEFSPEFAIVTDLDTFKKTSGRYNNTKIYSGEDFHRLIDETEVDIVLNALYGMSGLVPTYLTVKNGRKLALANKESLVSAGKLITSTVKKNNSKILPVDSEHSAIWQCMGNKGKETIEKLILTASGGPFRALEKEAISKMTAKDALKHPNWDMGAKITIDSATMVNKAIEKIEAKWLFDIDDIDIVVHPQSIIHSMIQFIDSSILAQMGLPDMKVPIAYAMFEEERKLTSWERIDFAKMNKLTFEQPDYDKFPGLKLGELAINLGGSMPLVFNTANEIMVEKFLRDEISFYEITDKTFEVMQKHDVVDNPTMEDLLDIEEELRKRYKF